MSLTEVMPQLEPNKSLRMYSSSLSREGNSAIFKEISDGIYQTWIPLSGEGAVAPKFEVPASQGKGYGQLLLSHFIEQAKILSNDKLWLEVRAKNFAAQMLYIKNGFEEVSRRTGYYPSVGDFGGYEDAIIMSFNLAKSNLKQTRKSPLKTVKKPRNKR